jgi:hypothetical protein
MFRSLIMRFLILALMAFAINPGMGITMAQAAPTAAMTHHHELDTLPIQCPGHDCPAASHCCDMAHCMICLVPTPVSTAAAAPQSALAATLVMAVASVAGYPPERPPRTL